MTEAQKRAKARYRDKLTRVQIDFYLNEQDLIERLNEQPNKSQYIKALIRADAELHNSNKDKSDRQAYEKAKQEYLEDPTTYSHEEVIKMLDDNEA